MVCAVQQVWEDFNKSLQIEVIARELGMSVSGAHAHFSALHFQKQLWLQEARRLMLSENLHAAQAMAAYMNDTLLVNLNGLRPTGMNGTAFS